MARQDSFPDHKVLELLLFYALPRCDTNEVAHTLLDRFGSLSGVLDADVAEVQQVDKVGEHAAVLFKAVKEISRRYLAARVSTDNIIRSTRDAYALLRPYFFGAKCELLYALCTDGKHKALGIRKVGEGTVNSVRISARLVAEAALSLNAACVIIAHNHVSGLAIPSPEDRAATITLRENLAAVEIELLDHLVFVDDDMVSMRDSGFFPV